MVCTSRLKYESPSWRENESKRETEERERKGEGERDIERSDRVFGVQEVPPCRVALEDIRGGRHLINTNELLLRPTHIEIHQVGLRVALNGP